MNRPAPNAALLAADLQRQLAHWLASARTFRDAEEFAAIQAWRSVEAEIGLPLRRELHRIVEELIAMGEAEKLRRLERIMAETRA